MKLKKEEILRKMLHLIALLMPASIFYIPETGLPSWVAPVGLGLILLVSIATEYIRLKNPQAGRIFLFLFGKMMRDSEEKSVTGSTYIIAGAFLCSILFINVPHVSFISLFLFITGDAMAAVFGISFGKTKFMGKSLEGSLACLICCIICLYIIIPFFQGVLMPWNGQMPFHHILLISMAITILELIPLRIGKIRINDNLAAPVLSGLFIFFLLPRP